MPTVGLFHSGRVRESSGAEDRRIRTPEATMRDEFDNSGRPHFPARGRRSTHGAANGAAHKPAETEGAGRIPSRNERRYLRVGEPITAPRRDAGRAARRSGATDAEEEPGYVIHLAVRVGTVDSAVHLAYAVAAVLSALPEVDPGETTVSGVDDQNNRRRVFCDLPLPDRSRCSRPFAHPGECGRAEPGVRR
ncbi:hypothetical protein ACFFWC_23915 [Plantactinospora siamensis]|uniref:Uncharacterized protein n=1 Tax=Plantactinospora siamensis TaxID=555372 RepID=A0ABV6P532_9ACTN